MNLIRKTHAVPAVTPTLREHLAQKRAAKALARRTGWLGSGNRWMAFAAEGCACGCGQPDPAASAPRRARR